MNWMEEIEQTESLYSTITTFIEHYGLSGLKDALSHYSAMQPEYICKTKSTISKLKIDDIYYLEIRTHTITIHTQNGTYQKYGSLTDERNRLSPYGFIKCNQSSLVSVRKIRSICDNTITLVNGIQLHMSQRYAPKVLASFSHNNISKNL